MPSETKLQEGVSHGNTILSGHNGNHASVLVFGLGLNISHFPIEEFIGFFSGNGSKGLRFFRAINSEQANTDLRIIL